VKPNQNKKVELRETMSPEDEQALANYSREIGRILHRNAPKEAIKTLEGIETTVRGQILEYVNPEIALFLSKLKQESIQEENEQS
jgi:hypothetical protein